MNVLVACEESQAVCIEFRKRGHRAFSCDIQECSGGHPEWHIQGDVLPLLDGRCQFMTADTHTHTQAGRWDLIIAHPPCTYLTVSGNAWFNTERYGKKAEQRYKDRVQGAVFFMMFAAADCDRIAIENPIGIMSTAYRKADQIIQPYEFGHHARKSTCLWLKGLPLLKPTEIVDPGRIDRTGHSYGASSAHAVDENGKILSWNDPRTAKARSKTFPGIAKAMAEQWGDIKKDEAMSQLIDKGELLNRIAVECNYDTEHPLESYTKLISIINSFPAKTSPFDEGHPVLQGDQYSWF